MLKLSLYAPFTDCISKINNIKVDNGKDTDVAMPMYILIEYSDIIYGNNIGMNQF